LEKSVCADAVAAKTSETNSKRNFFK